MITVLTCSSSYGSRSWRRVCTRSNAMRSPASRCVYKEDYCNWQESSYRSAASTVTPLVVYRLEASVDILHTVTFIAYRLESVIDRSTASTVSPFIIYRTWEHRISHAHRRCSHPTWCRPFGMARRPENKEEFSLGSHFSRKFFRTVNTLPVQVSTASQSHSTNWQFNFCQILNLKFNARFHASQVPQTQQNRHIFDALIFSVPNKKQF